MEFQACQQKSESIAESLYEKALEVWKWENENLGAKHDVGYRLKTDVTDCIEFYRSGSYAPSIIDEDYSLDKGDCLFFRVYERWARGGYEEKEKSIPLYKLLGDDWRKIALKEYHNKLEEERKKEEAYEAECERKAEEREFAEYERLKAKFEGHGSTGN